MTDRDGFIAVWGAEGEQAICPLNVDIRTDKTVPVARANAALIAAAPDLLAACEALPDFDLERPDAADFTDHAADFMRAMRLARAAIAKARGTT